MALVQLTDIFEASYGSKLDLNKMKICDKGVIFIGRSRKNHGVSAIVEKINGVDPWPSGSITVALGGSILSSFVQTQEFYTAQNVAVLIPKIDISFNQKLFYCMCIRHNRFRYSAFGREANRTFQHLMIPDIKNLPSWLDNSSLPDYTGMLTQSKTKTILPKPAEWQYFRLDDLFDIRKGKRLTKANMTEGSTPFIGASEMDNGVTGYVGQQPIHEGGTITICYNGSVGEAFYQPVPFWASDDVNVLYPKFLMGEAVGLFLCRLIKKERHRFNYNRKWNLRRMNATKIKLPVDKNGNPDWEIMKNYISNLQCGNFLEQ